MLKYVTVDDRKVYNIDKTSNRSQPKINSELGVNVMIYKCIYILYIIRKTHSSPQKAHHYIEVKER